MPDRKPEVRNEAAPWSAFDADVYAKLNYASLIPEDEEIIRFAAGFLVQAYRNRPLASHAVDVGSGPNLYPALLMLPWVERITFTEIAPLNIGWLKANLPDAPEEEWAWQPFWELMARLPEYENIREPRQRLAGIHHIVEKSIFELPSRTWDLGSMFFVADGISSDQAEFELAVRSFLTALRPGAPFMMAFMEGSTGYEVSGVAFPAVRIRQDTLIRLLADLPVAGTQILRTDKSIRPLRPGYDSMLLVVGYVTDG
ncbi:MAG TPA: SCO2525 family SAM-dependent methyltransferase [Streptosporangiaceae bacterium]|nr:SCO2525 family SAM-dependent methyltransferase [Streptosporangiaceae bacterium]